MCTVHAQEYFPTVLSHKNALGVNVARPQFALPFDAVRNVDAVEDPKDILRRKETREGGIHPAHQARRELQLSYKRENVELGKPGLPVPVVLVEQLQHHRGRVLEVVLVKHVLGVVVGDQRRQTRDGWIALLSSLFPAATRRVRMKDAASSY